MNHWNIAQIIYSLIILFVCVRLIYESRQPARTYAMLLLIIFVPVLGLLFYLFFGQDRRKTKLYSKKLLHNKEQQKLLSDYIQANQIGLRSEFPKEYLDFQSVSDLVFADIHSMLSSNNKLDLLINGEEKFPKLKQDLLNAKKHIHMQYFIYEDDEMGTEIGNILVQKVKEGVDVRVLYDYFGSFGIKSKTIKNAKDQGVEVATFHKPTLGSSLDRLNFRNHRKIVVIDGEIAYTGGLNISNDYINDDNYPSKYYWRDSHLKLEGRAVWNLQQLFLSDWNFANQCKLEPNEEYFPSFPSETAAPIWTQTVDSGPDSDHQSILLAYIEAINSAKRTIKLSTPYFIPSPEFLKALTMASLRGVEISLLVPAHSDSWYANAAAKSYYEDLLNEGVKLYFYERGMFHAKTMVCDSQFTMIGTANLDYRSFDLNFEVNCMVFDTDFAIEMEESFEHDVRDSRLITKEIWNQRSVWTRFFQKLMALLGPVL